MIEMTTIARPYAKAAFEAASEAGRLDAWARFLDLMAGLLDNDEVVALFDNPQMNRDRILSFLASTATDVLKADFDEGMKNFLALLAENGRFRALPEIDAQFHERLDAANGVVRAEIETALPMDESTLASLVKTLEAHYNHRVEAVVTEDPTLIGGVRVTVGDEVIDASVREKLNSMAAALTQ